ncbi:MAG: FmdB family zinc ribbon protein [Candidatus Methylomirabilales bacterium]
MPIYEYQCEVCGHTFEVIQKFSDDPIASCVVCSGSVHRVLSPPALVFKGTGWYVTDYANPERKRAQEREHKRTDGSSGTNGAERPPKADNGTADE